MLHYPHLRASRCTARQYTDLAHILFADSCSTALLDPAKFLAQLLCVSLQLSNSCSVIFSLSWQFPSRHKHVNMRIGLHSQSPVLKGGQYTHTNSIGRGEASFLPGAVNRRLWLICILPQQLCHFWVNICVSLPDLLPGPVQWLQPSQYRKARYDLLKAIKSAKRAYRTQLP